MSESTVPTAASSSGLPPVIRAKLSVMMFLEFFIWGAWFVTLGTYLVQGPLQASAGQVATAFLSQSIGAIGVSTGTIEQDQEVASAGAAAYLEFAIA